MHSSKVKLQTYSTASRAQISEINQHLDPRNANLYPSMVKLWYDELDIASFVVADRYVLAKLYPYGEDPIWAVGSQGPLQLEDWLQISEVIKQEDSVAQPLNLVSKHTLDRSQLPANFEAKTDSSDLYEYIYDCAEQAACTGGKFEDMRRQVRLFFKQYGSDTKVKVDSAISGSIVTRQSVMHLFDDWIHFGTDGTADAHDEAEALRAFFDSRNHKFFNELVIIRLFYKNKLVGFSVCEILNNGYATNIFHKTNLNLSGISYYMFYSMMELLHQKNIQYLNFQEDVGIQGLRAFKNKMRPAFIDKRYKITITD